MTSTRRKALSEYGIEEIEQADGSRVPSLKPDEVKTAVNLLRWLQKDGHGFVRAIGSQLGVDVATAPAAAAPPKPAEDPEPQADVPLADGRAVFSADQLRAWHQWQARKQQAEFEKTYGPIRDAHELQQLKATHTAEAKQLIAHATANWKGFGRLKKQVAEIIAKDPRPLTNTSLHEAYIAAADADREQALATARQQWDAERTGQLSRKADASTVHPGAPRPSTPRPDAELSTRDIVRQEYRRHAAG